VVVMLGDQVRVWDAVGPRDAHSSRYVFRMDRLSVFSLVSDGRSCWWRAGVGDLQ
jgi:hypothetical protein